MIVNNKRPILKLLSMSLLLGISVSCADNKSQTLENFEQSASEKIKALAGNLKKELSESMQSGGPVAAITTCRIKAPEITNALNSTDTVKIKRTSLRLRNPANEADNWEQQVLTSFEDKHSSGTPVDQLVYSEEIKAGDKTTFRMMRAIPMQPVCLSCHGDKQTMGNELISTLEQAYPDDRATGFSVGDIRGAFSVSQTIGN
tara:strand:+ start:164 stop:769 length:606 start_codon:yes stop_codon:yes gene_type:complete